MATKDPAGVSSGDEPSIQSDTTYSSPSGQTFDLGTADGLRGAVADLSGRLDAMAATDGGDGSGAHGDVARRLARLEYATSRYFRDAFAEFDEQHPAE